MIEIIRYDPKSKEFSASTHRRMARALMLARLSTEHQKHGALLMQNSSVLGVGVNSYKNAPDNVDDKHIHRISVHAEVAACRSHLEVPNTTLYVARVGNGNNTYMNSKPCSGCMEWLMWTTNVKRVVHS